MSNPVFWGNKKNLINLSSADFAQRVGKVNNDKIFTKTVKTIVWFFSLSNARCRNTIPLVLEIESNPPKIKATAVY